MSARLPLQLTSSSSTRDFRRLDNQLRRSAKLRSRLHHAVGKQPALGGPAVNGVHVAGQLRFIGRARHDRRAAIGSRRPTGEWIGGSFAAVAALGLCSVADSGELVDVSLLEAMAITMGGLSAVTEQVTGGGRLPTRFLELPSVEQTADGYVGFLHDRRPAVPRLYRAHRAAGLARGHGAAAGSRTASPAREIQPSSTSLDGPAIDR